MKKHTVPSICIASLLLLTPLTYVTAQAPAPVAVEELPAAADTSLEEADGLEDTDTAPEAVTEAQADDGTQEQTSDATAPTDSSETRPADTADLEKDNLPEASDLTGAADTADEDSDADTDADTPETVIDEALLSDTDAPDETTDSLLTLDPVRPEEAIRVEFGNMTDSVYDFTLDPQGLMPLVADSDLTFTEGAGVYFRNYLTGGCSAYSDPICAVNKGDAPVLVSVTLDVNNTETVPVTFTTLSEVERDEACNLSFAIVPVEAEGLYDGEVVPLTDIIDAQRADIDETGHAELTFYIPAYADLNACVGFRITAACNTRADWQDFVHAEQERDEHLSVHVTYRTYAAWDAPASLGFDLTPDPLTGVIYR